jgi:acetate kinase
MKTTVQPCVLTINGGSSSIKFALFQSGDSLIQKLEGKIEGIGLSKGHFTIKGLEKTDNFSRAVDAPDHAAAVNLLMDWIQKRFADGELASIGHRIVHGGAKHWEPERITKEMLHDLHQLSPFDPDHLPEEILLAEAFHHRFPELTQIACFDTAFHHDMPRVALLLPVPRRYEAIGVRRYGFHGLSCSFLMEELARIEGVAVAQGRVIIAHLGSGASLTAVQGGKSMDTSMGLTPAAGIPMSTRSGDLDPGLAWYLARTEQVTAEEFLHMVNHESGLLGISETSSDMQELLAHEAQDLRAAEAVAVFCYQAKKWIGGYAAALGGLETLIFAGGIGENAPPIRSRICEGLGFLGIALDESLNEVNAEVISSGSSLVTVRVIKTNEELMIARSVCQLLGLGSATEGSRK